MMIIMIIIIKIVIIMIIIMMRVHGCMGETRRVTGIRFL